MASPEELDILGITTVAGNVPLSLTQKNARLMCDIAGRQDIPVFAGCAYPMSRKLVTAEHVHGSTGINGVDAVEPNTPLQAINAVDFLISTLKSAEDNSITLVPVGPLTNIAYALKQEPSITSKISKIVIMGGAMREGGNITPSAEFNIYVDPQAADIVFNCGRPIISMGLDLTHQVLSTEARVARIKAIGNSVSDATAGMLNFFSQYDTQKYGSKGAPLHDPCTVAWLLAPELFTGKDCNLKVETKSELTMGHTAVDFWHVTKDVKNVHWVYSVDADGFYDLLIERLGRFS